MPGQVAKHMALDEPDNGTEQSHGSLQRNVLEGLRKEGSNNATCQVFVPNMCFHLPSPRRLPCGVAAMTAESRHQRAVERVGSLGRAWALKGKENEGARLELARSHASDGYKSIQL